MRVGNFSSMNLALNHTINNITSTTEDDRCKSLIENITVMTEHSTWFLVLLLSFGILGIFANCLVIRAIVVLGQNQNQSIRLLMYLSMVDILSALNNILRFFFANYPQLVTCHVARFIHIIGVFSIYSSIYMFSVTALDRYFKVHYLENYEEKFTPIRFRFAIAGYALAIVIQTTLATYFSLTYYIGYGSSYATPLNIVVFLSMTILYTKSTLQLRRYKKVNENLAENIQNIIKITQIYLYLFALYPVYIMATAVMLRLKILTKSEEIFTKQIATLIPCVIGSINAIYFFLMNKEAKNDIRLYLRYLRRTYFQSFQIGVHE